MSKKDDGSGVEEIGFKFKGKGWVTIPWPLDDAEYNLLIDVLKIYGAFAGKKQELESPTVHERNEAK